MIIVTGSVLARSGMFDEVLRISTEHVLRSRAEAGCLSHAVCRDTEEQRRLSFLERWTDMAALKAHFDVAVSRAFSAVLARLADEPPTMTLYDATEVRRRLRRSHCRGEHEALSCAKRVSRHSENLAAVDVARRCAGDQK